MNEIKYVLRSAARRLEMSAFVLSVHRVAIVLAAAALILALADRAPGEAFVAWMWVAPGLLAACLAVAAWMWSRRRLSELQVAMTVDDRLELREKLSTALHCHKREDPFAQAAVQDAVTAARDPRTRERLRRRFAVASPKRWWISPLIVLVVAAVLMLPQADAITSWRCCRSVSRPGSGRGPRTTTRHSS